MRRFLATSELRVSRVLFRVRFTRSKYRDYQIHKCGIRSSTAALYHRDRYLILLHDLLLKPRREILLIFNAGKVSLPPRLMKISAIELKIQYSARRRIIVAQMGQLAIQCYYLKTSVASSVFYE